MAEKKNQHFVPKVHLKNFATDDRKKQITIWLPKQDRVISGASIRDQCSKSYFYGKGMRIEEYFNSPEGVFGKIVEHLTETQEVDSETLQELFVSLASAECTLRKDGKGTRRYRFEPTGFPA